MRNQLKVSKEETIVSLVNKTNHLSVTDSTPCILSTYREYSPDHARGGISGVSLAFEGPFWGLACRGATLAWSFCPPAPAGEGRPLVASTSARSARL